MTTPLARIRTGALVLLVVITLSVCGYRWAGWSWIDSLYMVVITVASVGYREMGEMTPGLKLFTVVVIVLGMLATGYTIGGFLQMLAEGEIDRVVGLQRVQREVDKLEGHIVVCGYGRIGQMLTADLKRQERAFVVLEHDHARTAEALQQGFLAMEGDATEEKLLVDAGIARAKSLVTALPSDAANVFITLTARNLNRGMQIIARGEFPSTQKKLIQAGADRVVLPATIGATRISHMLTRPSVVEFMELVAGRSSLDVEIDELELPLNCRLVGQTVAQTEARRRHGLLVVAVKRGAAGMVFNPDADFAFAAEDVIIVMGKVDDIARFRGECEL